MNRKKTVMGTMILCLIMAAVAQIGAQTSSAFPGRNDPLHKRVDMFDALMRANHWNEGTMMQHVIFPPAGASTPIVGSQEDCAGITAVYLAAYSHRYHVTRDPQVRAWADKVLQGILQLEKVTGVPGVVARSFNRTEQPLWHEQVYFFPQEWHWSSTMPGYRWQGDLSSDKFTDFLYGVGTYWEFCADEAHKKQAADFIDRFMGRCVDFNFKLVDVDNKQTLWGNFCPDLPHQALNALEVLAGMKVAYRMTGKERYRAAYHMLIEKYRYDDEAIMAKVLWPEEWKTPWDDELAAKALYMLYRWESDPSLLIKYRMCLNRHWYDWKNSEFRHEDDVWFHMLYQVLTGEEVMTAKSQQAIKSMWGFDRRKARFSIPLAQGMKTVESEEEGNATSMVRNYWFGRHYGIIDPTW